MTSTGPKITPVQASKQGRVHWWNFGSNFAWTVSLFLAGLGAKLGLIWKFGQSFPYLDQWPAEAIELFNPYFSGKSVLRLLIHPHNEHYILFTRISEFALLLLNGQWDGLLECAFNAMIHCTGVAGLGWAIASLLGRKSWPLIWLVLFLDLALPFAWENTLWGFQSQFYFLLIFSWLAIWLLTANEALSWRWWLGALCGLAALFTVASGFLAAAAVMAVTGLAAWTQKTGWRRHLPTWFLCAIIIALGIALKLSVPTDHTTQVRSISEFARSLGKALAWPWALTPWYAPLNYIPLLILGWIVVRFRQALKPAELLTFGLGIWATLQGLAGAYARGIYGTAPAWRYMDSLSFIVIANALAAWLLIIEYRARFRSALLLQIVLTCWALAAVGGLSYLTQRALKTYIPEATSQRIAQVNSARAFLATGDAHVFEAQPGGERPVPGIEADVWLLTNPRIRPILPACARDPLHLKPAPNNSDAFVRSGWLLTDADPPTETSWGSYSAKQVAARGTFESLPLGPSALPYLEISVAGDLGAPGLSLKLIESNGGKVTEVRPSAPPGGQWVNVRVKAPAGEFKIVARDDSDTGWFAFKEPRELGRWSYWALKSVGVWDYILVLGFGGFVLNLARVQRWGGSRPTST